MSTDEIDKNLLISPLVEFSQENEQSQRSPPFVIEYISTVRRNLP